MSADRRDPPVGATPRAPAPAVSSALPRLLHEADTATAARALIAVQRGSGNAATATLVRGLARQPAAPAAEPAPVAEPESPEVQPDAPEGITDPESIGRYAARAREILDDWDIYKTPLERAQALMGAINAEIAASGGVPVAGIRLANLTTEGEFDDKTWTMTIDAHWFEGPKPGGGYALRAAVVAHEARHCEQALLAARRMAGRGHQWFEIVKQLRIPEAPARKAEAEPIKRGDPEAADAELFLKSMYGLGEFKTSRVMRRLHAAKAVYDQAVRDLQQAEPGDEAKQAAVDAARKELEAAQQAYRELPREADAFEFSDEVQRAMLQTPPP